MFFTNTEKACLIHGQADNVNYDVYRPMTRLNRVRIAKDEGESASCKSMLAAAARPVVSLRATGFAI